MDPESVVREFLTLHPDATEDPFAPKDGAAPEGQPEPPQAGARFRRLVTAAFGVVPAFRQHENGRTAPANGTAGQDSRVERHTNATAAPDVAQVSGFAPLATAHYTEPEEIAASAPIAEVPEPAAAAEAEIGTTSEPLIDSRTAEPGNRRRGSDRRALSLSAAAALCSRLGRALDGRDVTALLAEAAGLLDAVGVVVWLWDPQDTALRASVAHGYSDAVLASLPAVRPDETNAIAEAFRSGRPCLVDGSDGTTGAVVVPSLGPSGCVAVLALEVRHGGERCESVRAFATILAAQLGALMPTPVEAAP